MLTGKVNGQWTMDDGWMLVSVWKQILQWIICYFGLLEQIASDEARMEGLDLGDGL